MCKVAFEANCMAAETLKYRKKKQDFYTCQRQERSGINAFSLFFVFFFLFSCLAQPDPRYKLQ